MFRLLGYNLVTLSNNHERNSAVDIPEALVYPTSVIRVICGFHAIKACCSTEYSAKCGVRRDYECSRVKHTN